MLIDWGLIEALFCSGAGKIYDNFCGGAAVIIFGENNVYLN